jgi:hypothetical protein
MCCMPFERAELCLMGELNTDAWWNMRLVLISRFFVSDDPEVRFWSIAPVKRAGLRTGSTPAGSSATCAVTKAVDSPTTPGWHHVEPGSARRQLEHPQRRAARRVMDLRRQTGRGGAERAASARYHRDILLAPNATGHRRRIGGRIELSLPEELAGRCVICAEETVQRSDENTAASSRQH